MESIVNNLSVEQVNYLRLKWSNLARSLQTFDYLPGTALVDIHVVCAVLGRSSASVWRDAASGKLARPVRIGGGSTRWRVADIRNALSRVEPLGVASAGK